jgi:hypothetical protein
MHLYGLLQFNLVGNIFVKGLKRNSLQWIELAQGRVQWQALGFTAVNVLNSCVTINCIKKSHTKELQ